MYKASCSAPAANQYPAEKGPAQKRRYDPDGQLAYSLRRAVRNGKQKPPAEKAENDKRSRRRPDKRTHEMRHDKPDKTDYAEKADYRRCSERRDAEQQPAQLLLFYAQKFALPLGKGAGVYPARLNKRRDHKYQRGAPDRGGRPLPDRCSCR